MSPDDHANSLANWYIGLQDANYEYELSEDAVEQALDSDLDFLAVPITTNTFYTRVSNQLASLLKTAATNANQAEQVPTLASIDCSDAEFPESNLRPASHVSRQLYHASSWIDITSPDPLVADISSQVLVTEIRYAAFCGACNVIVPGPRLQSGPTRLAKFARAVLEALKASPHVQLHVSLPVTWDKKAGDDIFNLANQARQSFTRQGNGETKASPLDVWDTWHFVRTVCSYHTRLSIALNLSSHVPDSVVLARWACEPVRIVYLSPDVFQKTKNGVQMRGSHQQTLIGFMERMSPWLLLRNIGRIEEVIEQSATKQESLENSEYSVKPKATHQRLNQQKSGSFGQYVAWLREIQQRQRPKDAIEKFGDNYRDYLQNPLQPLSTNLDSLTYEVFEQDPVKYEWYERAICAALKDWLSSGKPGSGPDGTISIAVVGAGRGPLVTRALQASSKAHASTSVWALEKNPHAFALLQRHVNEKWAGRVQLARADMRSWKGPSTKDASGRVNYYPVDILVSELLGSFADNELSPECLDGVLHLLNQRGGISIPASYSAHLSPIAAPKLHGEIALKSRQGDASAAEIPYVVMLHAHDHLSRQDMSGGNGNDPPPPIVLQAWNFVHRVGMPPSSDQGNDHNRRVTQLDFPCSARGVCHGLAGYFESVLYESSTAKVEISTNPLNMAVKSRDMLSWFPIYFPLKACILRGRD